MSYETSASAPRRRAISTDFTHRSRARELIAPTREKLADLQQRVPLYLALAAKQGRRAASVASSIETALAEVDRELARLDRVLSEESPEIAANGFVADARRALENLRSRLAECRQLWS